MNIKQPEPTGIYYVMHRFFTWHILFNAPLDTRTCKTLEACFIAVTRPSLNELLHSDTLILLRVGFT